VLLARATFRPTVGEVFQVHRVQPPERGVNVQGRPALEVAVQMITFQPGGYSGWHRHPGPVFISLVSGEMTFYESGTKYVTTFVVAAPLSFRATARAHQYRGTLARLANDRLAVRIVGGRCPAYRPAPAQQLSVVLTRRAKWLELSFKRCHRLRADDGQSGN